MDSIVWASGVWAAGTWKDGVWKQFADAVTEALRGRWLRPLRPDRLAEEG